MLADPCATAQLLPLGNIGVQWLNPPEHTSRCLYGQILDQPPPLLAAIDRQCRFGVLRYWRSATADDPREQHYGRMPSDTASCRDGKAGVELLRS
jgi:hypothetical protein